MGMPELLYIGFLLLLPDFRSYQSRTIYFTTLHTAPFCSQLPYSQYGSPANPPRCSQLCRSGCGSGYGASAFHGTSTTVKPAQGAGNQSNGYHPPSFSDEKATGSLGCSCPAVSTYRQYKVKSQMDPWLTWFNTNAFRSEVASCGEFLPGQQFYVSIPDPEDETRYNYLYTSSGDIDNFGVAAFAFTDVELAATPLVFNDACEITVTGNINEGRAFVE